MARTITAIYDELVTEMASYASMSGLTSGTETAAGLMSKLDSNSRVSIWSLYLWIVAFGIWTLENLMDNHKVETEELAAATISGNDAWLVRQALLFEAGNSSLAVDAQFKVVYAVPNVSARIIKYAAVTREYGRAVVKVAKDSGGIPAPLSSGEITQFATYLNNIMYAGSKLVAVSRAADELKLSGTVYYNGLVEASSVEAAIEAALQAYLKMVPYDSLLSVAKVIDVVQSVPGVKDLVLGVFCRKSGDAYSVNPVPGPTYMPWSGYVVLESLDLTFVAV